MEGSVSFVKAAPTANEQSLEPGLLSTSADTLKDGDEQYQHDREESDSMTTAINGMKRKRTPTPTKGMSLRSRKRAKTSPPPTVPEVPETPPLNGENGLSKTHASEDEDGELDENHASVDTSAHLPEVANTSRASSETFDGEKTANAMEDVAQTEHAMDFNEDDSATAHVDPQQAADQRSITEMVTSNTAAIPEQLSPHVTSYPSSDSGLSSPPSSPTLRAQERHLSGFIEKKAQDVGAKSPALTLDAGEPEHDTNGIRDDMAGSITPNNRAGEEGDNCNSPGDSQGSTLATPASKVQPTQLPTPMSSASSFAEPADLYSAIKYSGRTRKPIKRYGDPVETPATPEELDAEPDSKIVVLQLNKPPAKKPSATSGSKKESTTPKPKQTKSDKTNAPRAIKATTKTPGESKARVSKSEKTDASPATTKSGKRRGRPRKQPQARAEDCLDGETVRESSNNIALPITTKADTRKSATTTKAAITSKGRNKSSTEDEPNITTVKGNKSHVAKPTKRAKIADILISLVPGRPPPIEVEPMKLQLSQKLSIRAPIESKPDPQGQPRVWAESRQALCETLPYFKKPQGGCYSNEGHVYGFLFDGVGHCREYLDENLILCRAGGSMEADSSTGGMIQKKDQCMTESQVLSVINDMKHHNPLIVICGNRNIAAPTKMPHQYNVLGWYKPVYVWAEKTQGKGSKVWTTIKYRLERLNQHLEPAWHSPKDDRHQISDEERAIAGSMVSKDCNICETNSPQIYLQGWMCLNPSCDDFWQLPNGWPASYVKEDLDYDPAFLLHRYELWKDEEQEMEPVPTDVKPPVPKVGDMIGDNLYYVNTRGVCCPECGRCNSRRRFKGWICENCGWKEYPKHHPVLPTMLHTPWDAAPTLVRNKHADGVQIEIKHLHGYKVSIYTFKGIDGRFIHLAASKELNEEDCGANAMFADIQTVDMGLERRVFAVSKMSGGRSEKPKEGMQEPLYADEPSADSAVSQEGVEPGLVGGDKATEEFTPGDLMTAFSMNYGMPYKFVASGGSQSFDDAPWPVIETRRRLNWAQKNFLSNQAEYMDFNEQLIFAYLEGQKIEYHDDGESGLGPRIATMSLGGRAKMHMRMKAKHYVGCSKVGVFTEERPVPGSIDGEAMYQKRLVRWEELKALKANGDAAAYSKRRKEIPKELGIFEKKMKKADDLVTVTLSHGDIIIMDGYDIQKYLEHKVVPEGYLRFALTCRTVLSDHLKPEELPSYKVEEDPITYNGPKLSQALVDG